MVRNFAFFLFVIPVLIKGKKLPCRDEPIGAVKFLLGRTFFGLAYLALVLISVLYIPLSLATVVVYLQPFWTSILAFFVNKESISPVEIVGMVICFAGVVGLTLSAQN
jgi:drug/metabolite transporter (DMT)-like permease